MPARRVLDVCLDAGARIARAGEFTERAFLAGRIDLVQAEAVADIVGARTRRGLDVALGQLSGSLSSALAALREDILNLRAEVEAFIDFPEEEIGAGEHDAVLGLACDAVTSAERLLLHSEFGLAIRDGISVALIGKPNVGKSSLMNALLRRDRSIVTADPGTTRDAIEECLHVDGVPVVLIDTAGWRESNDAAERAGVGRARTAAHGATLTALVVSAADGIDDADQDIAAALDPERTLVVLNKIDLEPQTDARGFRGVLDRLGRDDGSSVARVSALKGSGLDELRAALVETVLGAAPASESMLVTNARHRNALARTREALERAVESWTGGGAAELVAIELMEASSALGEITGETTREDVLARVFGKFCVGK
jgi:tRNA modification GTPase